MSSASPSSAKVDDFLSSLSSLSQQKLSEDSQRQRQLQRNIDELRSKSNSVSPIRPPQRPSKPLELSTKNGSTDPFGSVPSMKFNRNGSSSSPPPPKLPRRRDQDIDENPPPMPARPSAQNSDDESPPPLPTRKVSRNAPPTLPKKLDFGIDLIKPVARKVSDQPSEKTINPPQSKPAFEPKYAKFKSATEESSEPDKYRSFTSIEDGIKTGQDHDFKENHLKSKPPVPSKPSFASQPEQQHQQPLANSQKSPEQSSPGKGWLHSSFNNSKFVSTDQAQSIVKPSNLNIIAAKGSARNSNYSSMSQGHNSNAQLFIPKNNNPTDVKIQSSPKRERNSMSWLDSAVNKSPEQPKRNFVINKKPVPVPTKKHDIPEVEKNPPDSGADFEKKINSVVKPPKPDKLRKFEPERPKSEALEQLEKLRKSPVKASTNSAASKASPPVEQDRAEFLTRFGKLKSSTVPIDKTFAKPQLSKYEEKDTLLIRQQLDKHKGSDSGVKQPPAKPPKQFKTDYEKQDSEILRSQMKKLNSRPVQKSKDEDEPEGLQALNKLKSTKAPPKPAAPKPEALMKFDALKKEKPIKLNESKETEGVSTSKEPPSFQDKLSSILRSSTLPAAGRSGSNDTSPFSKPAADAVPAVARASTFPGAASGSSSVKAKKRENTEGAKLNHTTKSRSKGPKRKLPGKMKKGGDSSSASEKKSTAVNTITTEVTDQTQISDYKKKKVPPPVNRTAKKNALENLKPSRNFSGEVFV